MMRKNQNITFMAILTVLGLVIFVAESAVPKPLPWAKPGLSNIVTVMALVLFNTRCALLVVGMRVVLAAFIFGTFANPAFLLSLVAGMAAALVMGFAYTHMKHIFSIIGISVMGAVTHNVVQLACANILLVRNSHLFYLLPWMILPALVTGVMVGFITVLVISYLQKTLIIVSNVIN
jgi:heptaprenyl diphosphate synthase